MSIYLDNASTTPVCPEAAAAALEAMTVAYGNPGSIHRLGREAKKLLDFSRSSVAKALGCAPSELYFTSCGSESDNWAIIRGAQYAAKWGRHIISSPIEHSAVLKSLEYLEKEGFEVSYAQPASDGSIPVENVKALMRPDTCLVSLMLVNNELGSVTDIAAIARMAREVNPKVLIHTDAVQAFMKLPFSPADIGADMVSISGHKIHAPKGIGALFIRKGLNLPPYILGGGQEEGKRSGTESMPLVAAFGAACEAARKCFGADAQRMSALRDRAVGRLTSEIPGLVVMGGGAPHILSISLPGYRSEVIMNYLEARDIFVSKSSACKKGGRSYVLEKLGLAPTVVDGAIRVSLSRLTTPEDIECFCDALRSAAESLRHR